MSFNNSTFAIDLTKKAISVSTFIYVLTNIIPYFPLVCSILGLIGFLGNAFTFLQPALRSIPCCIYTLSSSLIDIIHLLINVFPDYLKTKHGIKLPWNFSDNLCKLYLFLYSFLPQLAINFLFLTIIDQFACTCALTSRIRRLSHLKMVPRMISIALIISCVFSIHGPVLGYIPDTACTYREPKVYSLLNIFINGIMQPVVMLVFVLLTYRNIRQSRRRVGGTMTNNRNRFRNQFIAMIITQVLATAVFSLQWMIGQTYVLFKNDRTTSVDDLITIVLFLSFTVSFYSLNNVKSFYFSMLTSKLYRQTFIKGLVRLFPQRLHPIN